MRLSTRSLVILWLILFVMAQISNNKMESPVTSLDIETTMQNAKDLLQTLQSGSILPIKDGFCGSELSFDLTELEKNKKIARKTCVATEAKQMFYQYLNQDTSSWPTNEEADKLLTEATEEFTECKAILEKEKANAGELLGFAEKCYESLQQNIQEITAKVSLIEEKKEKLQTLKKNYEELQTIFGHEIPSNFQEAKQNQEEKLRSIEKSILNCEQIQEASKSQIAKLEETKNTLCQRIEAQKRENENIQKQQEQILSIQEQVVARHKELLMRLQNLAGIKEHLVGDDCIRLEFLNPNSRPDDPQLFVDITLERDMSSAVRMKSIQVSIDSLHAEDLIKAAIEQNDVAMLVTKLRERWLSHYPLVNEMKRVADCHAVDWIQDKNLVRVLVGKGGSIMCTLAMPETYPFSGEITLVQISGLSADQSTDVPAPTGQKSLQNWVDHLEGLFGKP